jgi:hypothetical protein
VTEQDLTALANLVGYEGSFHRLTPIEQLALAEGYLSLLAERDEWKERFAALLANRNDLGADLDGRGRWIYNLEAERDALKAQLEDERVWRRDAERVAAGGKCSCWLGRPGATFGSSTERQACAIHGDHHSEAG